VVGTSEKGEAAINDYDFTGPVVLLLGNEAEGLSQSYEENQRCFGPYTYEFKHLGFLTERRLRCFHFPLRSYPAAANPCP